MNALKSNQGGWTLIEITIVISLITILASIAVVGYQSVITRSKEAVLMEDLFQIRNAIDQYYADKEEYPPSLEDLVISNYLRSIPVDPFTRLSDTWVTRQSDLEIGDPLSQGIFDVSSGYDGIAIDGTSYNEW